MDGNGKWAPRKGHIPGVAVNLGGHQFVLAPLGLRLAREFSEKGQALRAEGVDDSDARYTALGIEMVHASLARNYEISVEEVSELLDMGNLQEATAAIAAQSGLKRVTPGELKPGNP